MPGHRPRAAPANGDTLSVVGSWSSLPLHAAYEVPYWETSFSAAVPGMEVEMTTHNEMNLGVADVYPLLGQGVYDVAMTVVDYAVADAPELEGLDVPLIATTADEARAMVEAAKPMVADFAKAREILTTEVLPDWASRAGPGWAARWNDSVGAVTGVTIE